MRSFIRWTTIAIFCAAPELATSQTFFPVDGFEESVKPVVSADREILVVPTESQDGTSATLQIFDLDAATGNVIGQPLILGAADGILGWENGVGPIVLANAMGEVVVAPTENESGTQAAVLVLQLSKAGAITDRVEIPLGDLGFQDDVGPIGINYHGNGVIVPLETENDAVAGVLAIKIDAGANQFGACTVVTSDGRAIPPCVGFREPPTFLTGFRDGVDGVAYTLCCSSRFAIPLVPFNVTTTGDLGFFDFDFGVPGSPAYGGALSVKALNSGGMRPVSFPGFERDVDIALLDSPIGGCQGNGAPCRLIVPVEDPAGSSGDLYRINGITGLADWDYNLDNVPSAPRILGYEEAVDVVAWLGANPPLLAVPTENRSGSDADLLLVNVDTGALVAGVEGANPGFRVTGFEKGVEPLLWSASFMVVPEEDALGRGSLFSINSGGVVQSTVPTAVVRGFERSVDPVTLPLTDPDRTLYVPIERQDQTDANLLIFPGPPPSFAGLITFEAANPGVTVSGFERDVDASIHEKGDGYQYLYVPEELPGGGSARLRVQPIPYPPGGIGNTVLALPTESEAMAAPGNLYFLMPNGVKLLELPDVLGYELGVGPTSAIGDTKTANPPFPNPVTAGYASDSDNTLTMENSYFGDIDGDGHPDTADCAPYSGGVWAPPTVVAGTMDDPLAAAITISWTSQDGSAGPDTTYDVATGLASELHADGNFHRAVCLSNDVLDTPSFDFRLPPSGDAFYWIVRAQNACGTATWTKPELDAVSPCP